MHEEDDEVQFYSHIDGAPDEVAEFEEMGYNGNKSDEEAVDFLETPSTRCWADVKPLQIIHFGYMQAVPIMIIQLFKSEHSNLSTSAVPLERESTIVMPHFWLLNTRMFFLLTKNGQENESKML